MNNATEDHLKHELYNSDNNFRSLVDQHRKFEARLTELTALPHPTEQEIEEEGELKRKKLAIKDQIYAIIEEHAKGH